MLLSRGLPLLIALGLVIYGLIDCLATPGYATRNLSKWGWLSLIVLFPVIGAVAWLLAGRPQGERNLLPPVHRRSRPVGPDDDPDFLRQLRPRTEQQPFEGPEAEDR